MNKVNKRYVFWLMIMMVFFTLDSHVNAAYDSNPYQRTDWRRNSKNGFDLNSPQKTIVGVESYLQKTLDLRLVTFGMIIGGACVFAGNYYLDLYEKSKNSCVKPKKQKSDKDVQTEEDAQDAYVDFSLDNKNKTSALSFYKRVEILEKSLSKLETIDLNISLIACMTQGYSRVQFEKFIKILKKSATEYNIDFMDLQDTGEPIDKIYPIDMSHVELAIEEMVAGSRNVVEVDLTQRLQTAVHESGHAAALINSEVLILFYASIVNRMKSLGRVAIGDKQELPRWADSHYKEYIVFLLSGGISEQVFGFKKSWYKDTYPLHREQDFFECGLLAQNKNVHQGLADLLAIPGAVSDMVKARHIASYIVKKSMKAASVNQEIDKHDIENQVCKILEECYQKAYVLIKSRKAEIKTLANLLMKNDTVSGDVIYSIFGTVRPAYAYEIKPSKK